MIEVFVNPEDAVADQDCARRKAISNAITQLRTLLRTPGGRRHAQVVDGSIVGGSHVVQARIDVVYVAHRLADNGAVAVELPASGYVIGVRCFCEESRFILRKIASANDESTRFALPGPLDAAFLTCSDADAYVPMYIPGQEKSTTATVVFDVDAKPTESLFEVAVVSVSNLFVMMRIVQGRYLR